MNINYTVFFCGQESYSNIRMICSSDSFILSIFSTLFNGSCEEKNINHTKNTGLFFNKIEQVISEGVTNSCVISF